LVGGGCHALQAYLSDAVALVERTGWYANGSLSWADERLLLSADGVREFRVVDINRDGYLDVVAAVYVDACVCLCVCTVVYSVRGGRAVGLLRVRALVVVPLRVIVSLCVWGTPFYLARWVRACVRVLVGSLARLLSPRPVSTYTLSAGGSRLLALFCAGACR
jgi:hypothetical protein